MEHYKVTKIDEKTYPIREEEFVNTYLLPGTDAALLIDTGNGSYESEKRNSGNYERTTVQYQTRYRKNKPEQADYLQDK